MNTTAAKAKEDEDARIFSWAMGRRGLFLIGPTHPNYPIPEWMTMEEALRRFPNELETYVIKETRFPGGPSSTSATQD